MREYRKIIKLNQAKKSVKEISEETKLDPKTVRKYLGMNPEEFENYLESSKTRSKILDIYKDEILDIFRKNTKRKIYTSSIYDYLIEKYGHIEASERSLRNYIKYLKETGEIKKEVKRIYEPTDETAPGYQMQLDFGEEKTNIGKEYIFATLLSNSRNRFVITQSMPFKTKDVICYLINAFTYYGGIPKEIVIDQDKLMVVSENHGDIVYTEKFNMFKDEMGFNLYVCRKADPESKGKVENLVKFVKTSFFSSRSFSSHEEVNEGLKGWMKRTANGRICQATGRIPDAALKEERPYLKTLRHSIFAECNDLSLRRVDKQSLISVSGCKYSVPCKYADNKVLIKVDDLRVKIYDPQTKQEIAEHNKAKIGQKLVKNANHYRLRDKKLKDELQLLSNEYDSVHWKKFVNETYRQYQRYFRDQINLWRKYRDEYTDSEILFKAIKLCIDMDFYSFKSLNESYHYYQSQQAENLPDIVQYINPVLKGLKSTESRADVKTRAIDYYSSLLSIMISIGGVL